MSIAIFLILVAAVLVMGLTAGRWNQGKASHIEDWGLGGRSFGTVIAWFLIGGDA